MENEDQIAATTLHERIANAFALAILEGSPHPHVFCDSFITADHGRRERLEFGHVCQHLTVELDESLIDRFNLGGSFPDSRVSSWLLAFFNYLSEF
jgi:hypothetical protein